MKNYSLKIELRERNTYTSVSEAEVDFSTYNLKEVKDALYGLGENLLSLVISSAIDKEKESSNE